MPRSDVATNIGDFGISPAPFVVWLAGDYHPAHAGDVGNSGTTGLHLAGLDARKTTAALTSCYATQHAGSPTADLSRVIAQRGCARTCRNVRRRRAVAKVA